METEYNKNKPIISLCIVTYFHEKYIRRAIESSLSQKVNVPYEIIVSDDCSTDNTLEIIREYTDKVKIVEHKERVGLAHNFFDAFKAAEGDYISLIAGDDWILTDDFLQRHLDYLLENDDCVAVAHNVELYDQDDKLINRISFPTEKFTLKDFLDGKSTCLHYGLVRNVFKRDNLEWVYKSSPKTDEVGIMYYLLTQGKWGLIEDYCYAHRIINDNSEQNYNSTNTAVDTFIGAKKGFEYINANVNNQEDFSEIINGYGAVVVRGCLYNLIKKKDATLYKHFINNTIFKERIRYYICYLRLHFAKIL